MKDVKQAVAGTGAALAVGALAKRLVRREMPAERKELLRQAYAEAGADPAYRAEMAEIDRAFDVAVGDGLDQD